MGTRDFQNHNKGAIMRTVYISLPTVEAVQKFVELISPLSGQFDLLSDEYILDAKSLMGIFKLDLTAPIKLQIEKATKETMQIIKRFIVEDPSVLHGHNTVMEDYV